MSLLNLSRKRRSCDSYDCIQSGKRPAKRNNCFNESETNTSRISLSMVNATSMSCSIDNARRCGKIIKIHLINFMCHSNLLIEFHPRVNFLVGSNGSGKSAILAAVILGLGCNAKTTSRSRSAKEFIKVGESTAKIEITISNDGQQPFEHDVYGDYITIIRTISGTYGNYAIKSASGSIISRKFEELQRIILFHNIQVDNPVFVLNQDFAREFLKDLEPSKNYKVFLKATQIDTITEKLNECLHLHKAHVEELKNTERKLKLLDEDIKKYQDKLEEALVFHRLKNLLKTLEIECAWLKVKKYEDELEQLNQKLTSYESEKSELESLNCNNEVQAITEKIQEQDILIKNKTEEYNEAHVQLRQLKAKYNESSTECAEYLNSQDALNKKKSRLEKTITDIEEHIEKILQKNEWHSIRQQNESKLIEYRRMCNDNLLPIINTLKHDLNIFVENKCQKQLILDKIIEKQKTYEEKIYYLKNNLNTLKNSSKEKMLVYGEYMPQLIDEINKAYSKNQFSKVPIGPIGAYVNVKNNKYRNLVETVIGTALLKAFFVQNSKDRHVLDGIVNRLNYPRLTIITAPFTDNIYNVEKGKVLAPPGTSVLMDEIKCSNPMVLNYLIDRLQIETVLLTNSKQIAENITSFKRNVPKNLNKVIVFNEESTHGMEYYPEPTYRMYSIKIQNAKLIQVTIKEHIQRLGIEMNTIEKELHKLRAEQKQIDQQLSKDTKNINEKRSILQKNQNELSDLQIKITDLENFEYSDYSKEVAMLRKEIEDTKITLADIDEKLHNFKMKYDDCKIRREHLENDIAQKKTISQAIQKEIETLKVDMDQIKFKLRSINTNASMRRSKLQEIQLKKDQCQISINKTIASLNTTKLHAKDKGERPVVLSTAEDEIREKIAKTTAQLKHGQSNNLDEDSLRQLIATKQCSRENVSVLYENLEITIRNLRQSLKYRFDFLRKFKRHMSLLIEMRFANILKVRNFSGQLQFDHKEKRLNVSITPRDHDQNVVTSTRALSGGERSYSTIALLLALWSVTDHPFYILDEYDVFTDEVNRECMKHLLIDEGRKRSLRQYLFLTPQDMSLEKENFIKIYRLAEPDRHS